MKSKKLKNIGIISPDINNPYVYKIWLAYLDLREKYGVNFIFFNGKELNHPDSERRSWNYVYDLITDEVIDGLLVLSGSLFHFVSLRESLKFYEKFKNIPVVNISLDIGNFPAVLTDNKSGMKELVTHFIKDHNKKRIVFVTGPSRHLEAIERLEAYKEALIENNLKFDPSLVIEGDFHPEKAVNSMKNFLSQKIEFDSVIAANDFSALAVMELLQNYGYKIPEEIIIGGYDDSYEAQFSIPPLTSVHQPLDKMAQKSIELLFDIYKDKKSPRVVVLDTYLVRRESCGCVFEEVKYKILSKLFKGEIYFSLVDFYNMECEKIFDLIVKEATRLKVTTFLNVETFIKIIEELFYTVEGFSRSKLNSFIKKFGIFLLESKGNEVFLKFLNRIFEELRYLIIVRCALNSENLKAIDNLFKDINDLIFNYFISFFNKVKLESYKFQEKLQNVIQELVTTHDEIELRRALESSLGILDVGDFFLNLFIRERYNKTGLPVYSRTFFGMMNNSTMDNSLNNTRFDATRIFPPNFPLENYSKSFLVMPVVHRGNRYGFMIVEVKRKEPYFYITLQEQISLTLSTQLLLYEVAEKNFFYKRELEMARNVQMQLLPSSPPNDKVAFFYQPIANVGGDFFYFIENQEKNEITFFIFDVAGHGLPAAIITSMIKSYILQYKRENFSDPAQFLLYLNNNLAEEEFDQYVTAFVGTLNYNTNSFTYCSAAHPMPFLVTEDGVNQIKDYNIKSLALGIYCNNSNLCFYSNFNINLQKGTRVLLYTDGLIDWIHNNEYDKSKTEFEKEIKEFEKFLLFTYKLQPKEFVKTLEAKINQSIKTGSHQDDICVVCFDV